MTRPLMTCHELVEFLDRYVEGALGDVERAEFDRHLSVCPPCVAYLDGYRTTIRLVGEAAEAAPETVPDALVVAVLTARRRR